MGGSIGLLDRTTRRKYAMPFERRQNDIKGKPTYDMQVEYAAAGSFGLKIRLVQRGQGSLLQPQPQEIIDDIIKNIGLIGKGDLESVRTNIIDDEYYKNFISHAKDIFPDGKSINNVGLITKQNTVTVTITKNELKEAISPKRPPREKQPRQKIFTYQGHLKISNGISDSVTLVLDDNSNITIFVRAALDDIAKKHFGDKVEVTCEKKAGKYHLTDIDALP